MSPPVEKTPDKISEAEERQNEMISSEDAESIMEEGPLSTQSQAAMDLTPPEQTDPTPPELIPMTPPERNDADIHEPDAMMPNLEDIDPMTTGEIANITDDIEVHEVEEMSLDAPEYE